MSEPTGPVRPRSSKGSAKANQEVSGADPQATSTPDVPAPGVDPAHGPGPSAAPTSAIPAATQPMPAAGAVPGFSEAVPAGRPPVGPPAGAPPVGPPAGPVGPTPGAPGGPGGPGGPPPKRPGLWRQATSTTGGLIAVLVAAALTALLVLGTVAAVGLVAVRAARHGGYDRVERVAQNGRQGFAPGQQRKLGRMPQGPGSQMGPGRDGQQNGGNGLGGAGNGMGRLLRGAMGLGTVQHGEFTVQQNGKAVVMTLQRGTVTAASANSVTVKSDDGFTATYVVNDQTRGRAQAPAVGDAVLVVAEKDGAKAVLLAPTPKG